MTHCTGLKGKASLSAPFGGSISLGSPVSPHRDVLSISQRRSSAILIDSISTTRRATNAARQEQMLEE